MLMLDLDKSMVLLVGADGKVEESLSMMKEVEELKSQKRKAEVINVDLQLSSFSSDFRFNLLLQYRTSTNPMWHIFFKDIAC